MSDKEKIQKRLRESLEKTDVVVIDVSRQMGPRFGGLDWHYVRLRCTNRRPFPAQTRQAVTNEILLQSAQSKENGEKAAARWLKWLYAEGILNPPVGEAARKTTKKKAKTS